MGKAIKTLDDIAPPAPVDPMVSLIERASRDPSVDLDRLERLIRMKHETDARAAETSYLAALAAMQAELPAVDRKGTGHNQKKYARFEDVIEAVKPHLTAHGFSLTFRIDHQGNQVNVVGVLGHRDGHKETTGLPLAADTSGNKNAVQAWGSSISYAKRYVTLALLGIATQEDDDGQKAGGVATINDEQLQQLEAAIKFVSQDVTRFCRHFKIREIKEMPAAKFQEAMEGLKAKAERQ